VQRAHRGVGIPGALGAVACKHLGQGVGVLGQMLQRHRTVLDKAHRFAVATQAHHDVEAGLAHFPQIFLCAVVHHLDHAAREPQVTHQGHQITQMREQWLLGFAAELHQQDGRGLTVVDVGRERRADGGRKRRVLQAQVDHGAIHQLHR
jgi:hypothetical protein